MTKKFRSELDALEAIFGKAQQPESKLSVRRDGEMVVIATPALDIRLKPLQALRLAEALLAKYKEIRGGGQS